MGGVTHGRPCTYGAVSAILPAALLCILVSASHDRLADWHLHHRRKAPSYFEESRSEKGCLTYKERYAIAAQEINDRTVVQEEASVAVIIRFYTAEKVRDDLVNSLRTAVFETERRGYHAYIFYELKSELDHPEEVEAVRERLPSDLRHHIIFWQEDVVLQEYSSLGPAAWQMGNNDGHSWGTGGPLAQYLPFTMFMHEHLAYDFAWVLEDDVRLIGDWGLFFSSAYAVAAASKQDLEGRADFRQDLRNGFSEASARKTMTNASLPDLIAFHEIIYNDEKWADYVLGLKRPFAQSQFQVWGGSRKLFEAMDRVSRGGAYAFYEMFVPTVAVMHDLTIVGLPLTSGTFECGGTLAEQSYRDWHLDEQSCLPYQLLHPIKLREERNPNGMSPAWMSSW